MSETKTERNEEIKRMRQKGWKIQDIADVKGITKQRVSKILKGVSNEVNQEKGN